MPRAHLCQGAGMAMASRTIGGVQWIQIKTHDVCTGTLLLLHRHCVSATQASFLLHRHCVPGTQALLLLHRHCVSVTQTLFLLHRECLSATWALCFCASVAWALCFHHTGVASATQSSVQRDCSEKQCSVTLYSVPCNSVSLFSVHGYARGHTSICIFYPLRGTRQPYISDECFISEGGNAREFSAR